MAIELTDANFDELVTNSGKPAMIDFWAEWCGPCRMIAPTVDEISEEYADRALVGKVDVDANPKLSARFHIRSIPTILFMKDGEIAHRAVGAESKSQLTHKLDSVL